MRIAPYSMAPIAFMFESREERGRAAEITMATKVPNPVDKYVGSRVRMRRQMLGMSQGKLADKLRYAQLRRSLVRLVEEIVGEGDN